jgi:hypothetical protein
VNVQVLGFKVCGSKAVRLKVERFQYEDRKNNPFCAGEDTPRPCPRFDLRNIVLDFCLSEYCGKVWQIVNRFLFSIDTRRKSVA